MLAELALPAHPPFLNVSSRLADDFLWAEVLNQGANDIVAKPRSPNSPHEEVEHVKAR